MHAAAAGTVGCIGAAAAHTAYKCGLFVLPSTPVHADLLYLATGTFLVGLVFGWMREAFGSLALPLAAHVAFDVLTYADQRAWPWWVT